MRRNGAMIIPILALVAIYRVPDFVSGVMANPLYIDLGFSKTAIATVTKLYGVWIGIAGVFAGGIAVLRLGLMPALLIGAIAASASHLAFAWLALRPARGSIYLTLAIGIESFASGFAGTALIAFMSSLTSPAYAAAQYALLSSLYALPGKLVGGLSGLMVGPFRLSAVLRLHLGHRHTGSAALPLRLARHARRAYKGGERLWPHPAHAREASLALVNRIR